MKTLLLLILMLPGAVYAQPEVDDTQTTITGIQDTATTYSIVTSPELMQEYKAKAAWATEVVITQADHLKVFKASTAYRDIWTSPAALQAYEDTVTSFANTLRAVQDGLLTTATEVLTTSQYEIQAAKQGMKHRQGTY